MSKKMTGAAAASSEGRAYEDLRSWLKNLAMTDRLAAITRNASLEFEVAGIAKRLDGKKATLFTNPSGTKGRIVSGLLSSRSWMAEALGLKEDELLNRFQNAATAPLAWNEVETGPCREVVNENPDLLKQLPIPIHNEHDSGAYITAGVLIVRNPKTGRQNVSIHRLQVSGPARLGALLLPRHTLAYYDLAEEAGQDLDVAIAIGVSPAVLLASQAIAPLDQDELEIAGGLAGRPLDVVRCVGSEIRVPAHSEIVIEGRFLAGRREPEGPFGEFPQYYGPRADRHVIEVDRITTRRDPVFHTIVGGGLEHLLLGGIPREATILATLRRSFPQVLDVHLSRGGVCRYHLYVKMAKTVEGQGKNVILGAFAAHYDIKHVVVVDEDVNIHDPTEVEWALATRFQADKDMVVVAGSQGSKLDPSTDDGCGAKLGCDATIPLDAPEMQFKRIHIPGEEQIDLAKMVDATTPVGELL